MHNHHYCNHFEYDRDPHFRDWERVTQGSMRNDYCSQHPEKSFTRRTAEIPGLADGNGTAINARNIRERQAATSSSRSSGTSSASSSRSTSSSTNSRRQ